MANYLITGAAGFIGARTAELLLQDGHTVVGIDNVNDAYDPRMKEYRLKRLQALPVSNRCFSSIPSFSTFLANTPL